MGKAFTVIGVVSAAMVTGCVSVQAIEPVQAPPASYRSNVLTRIEFSHPTQIGLRCSQRGAEYLGMPALSAGGCADRNLITMIDPCRTFTGGRFAEELCLAIREDSSHEPLIEAGIEQSHRDVAAPLPAASDRNFLSGGTLGTKIVFASTDEVALVCPKSDDLPFLEPFVCKTASGLIARNPCDTDVPSWYERTLCHEIGHVNGWPSDHPASANSLKLARASSSPEAMSFSGNKGLKTALE